MVTAADIVEAARQYAGSPYRWWDGSYPFTPGPAMYADWQNPGYYTPGYVRREGVNCTGLINLARMECGLEPIGGTGHYQDWLEASGTAEVFDSNTPGVPGALCVHRYEVGISEGHIALYSSSDAHTIIQSEAVNGVWEGDTDYASHQWADYEVYGLMPDVSYDATPIPAPGPGPGQEAEMWKWLSIDKDGWLRADGPDWTRGWYDREWTWHAS